MLRTLIVGVNVRCGDQGLAVVRIVWRGDAVTEKQIRLPMASFRYTKQERASLARIRQLADDGWADSAIAEQLAREGLFPCRGEAFDRRLRQLRRHEIVQVSFPKGVL